MSTTTLNARMLRTGFSNYIYDEASRFGMKVSVREPHQITEHSHENIQISIPISETSVEITWQRSDGRWTCALAHPGCAIIVPARQPHSVAWRKCAQFVNLHIDVDDEFADARRFLSGIVSAGEMHVIRDGFLYAFGENIISLMSRGVEFDSAFMNALRLIIVEHIIKNYTPERAETNGGRPDGPCPPDPAGEPTAGMEVDEQDPTDGRGRNRTSRKSSVSGLAPWQLRKVLAFINSDLKRDRSVDELAELVGLSKGHFSRAFQASTGLSPHRWIIQERLKLAMSKLAHTDVAIAEIASSCGFTEQSHFTRTFTKAMGISPAAWRRQNKV